MKQRFKGLNPCKQALIVNLEKPVWEQIYFRDDDLFHTDYQDVLESIELPIDSQIAIVATGLRGATAKI